MVAAGPVKEDHTEKNVYMEKRPELLTQLRHRLVQHKYFSLSRVILLDQMGPQPPIRRSSGGLPQLLTPDLIYSQALTNTN